MIWEIAFAIPVCLALCLIVMGIFGWDGAIHINVNHTIRHIEDEDQHDE